tara:strand:- start:776 stop:1375 length:600 start_codon:yes stop_codon:yes gene_type:complete
MMKKNIQFYFDVGSPTAYLAYHRLDQIKNIYDFDLQFIPILLGGVFKSTGNSSPAMVPAKGQYMGQFDLPRFSKLYGVPLNLNPHFPINTLTLMRGAVFAQQNDILERYLDAVFQSIWVHKKNLGVLAEVYETLTAADLNGQEIIEATKVQDIKDVLIANTENAIERGVFGVPTFFVDSEMFFGQDRIQFIEVLLSKLN